ncbi:unnamed protein product [Plutella xylostella]|uniref:(diamondback moth) hypothetical protein n=1 Tax=Plutella xylostella TaxID=51655 RepID=A0A8S4FS89_PLUXY|nr:unnamed protein product [Plutella xylostella]
MPCPCGNSQSLWDEVMEELQKIKQEKRANLMEIRGVPETENEDLFEIVFKIAMLLNIYIQKEQIQLLTRRTLLHDKAPDTILVVFHSKKIRDFFLGATRMISWDMKAYHLGFKDDNSVVEFF